VNNFHPGRYAPLESLEDRFGLRLAATLSERELDHDIGQRLRVARAQALERAWHSRRAATAGAVHGNGAGTLALGGSPWWLRLASVAPLVVLALGLLLVERIDTMEQIQAAAEIDAVLLADELPPRAYSDPGFGEFLKQPNP
jgi:hypothetical protein